MALVEAFRTILGYIPAGHDLGSNKILQQKKLFDKLKV